MQNVLLAFVTLIVVGLVVNGPVRQHLNKNASEASAQVYQDRAAAKSAYLEKACAEGKTGVVLFYKGKDCSAQ